MKSNIKTISEISIFTALLALLSQIVIPLTVPITLQSLAVMLSCMVLGGRRATISVAAYIALGAVGLPVFSLFGGGIGVLAGPLGGYIFGFLGTALVFWLFELLPCRKDTSKLLGCIFGIPVCYVLGTIQYYYVSGKPVSFSSVFAVCVLPFILPDALKAFLAFIIYRRLEKYRNNAS